MSNIQRKALEENEEYSDINAFAYMVQEDGKKHCEKKSVPSFIKLTRIIRTAFAVSCLFEEGRSLSFRICCFDIDDRPASVSGYGTRIFRFIEPLLLNVTNLKKIALSANPDRTMICVSALEPNSSKDLYITAIVFFISTYEDLSLGNTLSGFTFPYVLNLLVCGPGCISSCSGNTTLHTYKSGEIVATRRDLFNLPVFSSIIDSAQTRINDAIPGEYVTTFPVFKNYLQTLITSISKNNHGGSLLIIPNESDYTKELDIKYQLNNTDIRDFLVKKSTCISTYAENNSRSIEKTSSIMDGFKQFVSSVADFASVDGALVINYDGNVIGYGAEILLNSPAKLNVCFVGPDDVKKDKSILDYGTRHRSAFRFVKRNEGSVCFIFSQDGGIKACFNDKGKVYVYTDIENVLDTENAFVDFNEI